MEQEKHRKYSFFICYTRDSAEDLATHLRESLKKREITAFLDLTDIPKRFRKTDKWWKYRNEAIRNSETVLFVITHGFEKSDEVIREISLTFDEKKEFMLLRHKDLDHNIIIDLKDGQVNLGDYNQMSFENKHELLRKVLSAGVEEIIKPPYTPSIEKRKIQNDKAEIVPLWERKTQEIVLLPDRADIAKIGVTNDLLSRIYKEAYHQAIGKYDDAQFSRFTIQVFPFSKVGAKVNIYLRFYSRGADRICNFRFSDLEPQVQNILPDDFPTQNWQREISTTIPWKKSPQWKQFLSRAYSQIGPFAPAIGTSCHLSVLRAGKSQWNWILDFKDRFTGKEYQFTWNGKKINDKNIRRDY